MEILDNVSNEDYVIQRAKLALKSDPLSAKAWMLTAKTLYPNNFGVQVCNQFPVYISYFLLTKL